MKLANTDFLLILHQGIGQGNQGYQGILFFGLAGNPAYTSTREIISKKARGNKVDFSTIKITPKKVHGNNMDFLISEITSKKVRGNDVDFSISKITSKKYVEMTGNTSNLVFDVST